MNKEINELEQELYDEDIPEKDADGIDIAMDEFFD